MLLDSRTMFSDGQAVTASAISKVIDLGASPTLRDLPAGRVWALIWAKEAADAAGAATVTFSVESDSAADLATAPRVHSASAAIAKATLVAGWHLILPLEVGRRFQRYLGVRYTVAAGPLTAGVFSAVLADDIEVATLYPAGA